MSFLQVYKKTGYQDWRRPKNRRRHNPSYFGQRQFSRPKKKLPIKSVLTFFAVIFGLGGIFSVIFLAWLATQLPNPNKIIDRSVALSTKIYDRKGETLLYDIHGAQKRTFVQLADIPENLKNATLTAEDREFYQHGGISFTGIIRSLLKNIFTGSKAGGSTITQQLVKNVILSPEKTYTRKVKEVILSYQLEKKFSKDEILQMYFNEIPYGSVAYGAEAAAQTYFGKGVKDLSLAESAILAALPQAPTYYSPSGSHTDKLYARQAWILDSLADLGYITEEDAEFAKKEKIEFKKSAENIIAPHFVMFIKEYLTEKYGELAVEQGGLKIITTLDLDKQKFAEEAIAENAEKNLKWSAGNAALVALDPATGQILAMVGSKDYFDDAIDGQVNVATRARQPGSSFKPIVYAAAFKKGYTPETVLYDAVTKFLNSDGKDYEPKNYDLKERGPVTIRQALAGSLNIPAVKAIYLAGVDKVLDLADSLGYTTLAARSRFGLSLVLGGAEVKLLEHANAFAVFAREGEYHPAVGILKVEDKDGAVLEEYKKQEKKVLETQVARQINGILSDNAARAFIFGEKNYLTLPGRPAAAKTGTTNDYHDAWTIGFTPSLAAGVWVGNSDNAAMKRGADGSVLAAPIWNKFMQQALKDSPVEGFTAPDATASGKPVLNGQLAQGLKVKINKNTGKLATDLTPLDLVEERTYRQVHCILHFINKDDPQGNTLPDLNDPQYPRWEEAVSRWAKDNNIIAEDPPTESDDSYRPEDRPTISLAFPDSRQTITDRNFTAGVNVSAPRGVKKVEYYLEGKLLKTVAESPYYLSIYLEDPNLKSGFYQLKAIAYDDIGNNNSASVDLNFQLSEISQPLNWLAPAEGAKISAKNFPYIIKAELTDISRIQKVNVYYKNAGGRIDYINTSRQFAGGQLVVSWITAPAPGAYRIYAEITNPDGYAYRSEEVAVEVQ